MISLEGNMRVASRLATRSPRDYLRARFMTTSALVQFAVHGALVLV